jgi:hypothetical protein
LIGKGTVSNHPRRLHSNCRQANGEQNKLN